MFSEVFLLRQEVTLRRIIPVSVYLPQMRSLFHSFNLLGPCAPLQLEHFSFAAVFRQHLVEEMDPRRTPLLRKLQDRWTNAGDHSSLTTHNARLLTSEVNTRRMFWSAAFPTQTTNSSLRSTRNQEPKVTNQDSRLTSPEWALRI